MVAQQTTWLREVLTEESHAQLWAALLTHTAQQIESALLAKRYNLLGGLLLDKELR